MTTSTLKRFWSKVNKTETCWLWTASKRCKGYGAFAWMESGTLVQERAHRVSWKLVNGPVPDGSCVLHRCDVPACVNPSHLFLGTKADNNHDMCAKGRHVSGGTHCGKNGRWPRGENHHNCKLTESEVAAMRMDRSSGMSFSRLAAKYGIGIAQAWRICNNTRRNNE